MIFKGFLYSVFTSFSRTECQKNEDFGSKNKDAVSINSLWGNTEKLLVNVCFNKLINPVLWQNNTTEMKAIGKHFWLSFGKNKDISFWLLTHFWRIWFVLITLAPCDVTWDCFELKLLWSSHQNCLSWIILDASLFLHWASIRKDVFCMEECRLHQNMYVNVSVLETAPSEWKGIKAVRINWANETPASVLSTEEV